MSKEPKGEKSGASEPNDKWLKKFIKLVEENPWRVLAAGALIVWISGYEFIAFIQKTSQEAVLNEKFLSELSTRVRPTCVFNSKGSVESASGFDDYISDIHVVAVPANFGFKVTVQAKRHLRYEPILTCIDGNLHVSKGERGRKHDWVYEVVPNPKGEMFFAKSEQMDTNAVFRFKLEIIH